MNNLTGLFFKTLNSVKKDKFLVSSAIFFGGSLLASAGNYLFHFLMARMLAIETYGELQSLIAVFVIIGIPVTALSTVLVKYTADFKAKQQLGKVFSLLSFFTKKALFIGIIFLVVFLIFNGYIANFLKLTSGLPVMILAISFLVVFPRSINYGIIRGLEKFKSASIVLVAEVFLKIVLAVLLVKIGLTLNGVVGAVVLAGVISYFISFFPLRYLFKEKKEKIETRKILRYFSPTFFVLLFITLLYNMDVVLVKHFFSAKTAGEYGALAIIGRIIFFIGGPIVSVMFPMTASAYTSKSSSAKIFKKSIILVSLVGLVALVFYFIFPNFVIKMLVGSKFLAIGKFLGWFGIAMFLCSLVNLFLQYFLSIGKTKCVYLVVTGVLLEIVLISVFHNSLWQVIFIMNSVMFLTLMLLVGYFVKNAKCKYQNEK